MKSKKIQAVWLFLIVSAFTTAVVAQETTQEPAGGSGGGAVPMPMPTTDTSTLYGGSALAAGTFALGATTGFPETSFDVYFGLGPIFDLGIQTGFTYGNRLGGNRQRLGLDLHVPLRWTLLRTTALAGGLRASPYFMIGEANPAISLGADVAFLLDIPMPKIFTLIVGPELRTGFATYIIKGSDVIGYDGGAWVLAGIETLLVDKWHLGLMFHGGGQWGSGGLGGFGVFRAQLYFAAKL